jgi:hypothetical protein
VHLNSLRVGAGIIVSVTGAVTLLIGALGILWWPSGGCGPAPAACYTVPAPPATFAVSEYLGAVILIVGIIIVVTSLGKKQGVKASALSS